jgi:small subunit ribosomal protein S2
MSTSDMRELLKAGVHFGHKTRYWNPKMAPYIFGARNGIHIINLEKTVPMFDKAIDFVGKIAAGRGKVLFVGTKRSASKIIREEAERANMPYVDHRWLGGMLTNYKTIRQAIRRLKELTAQFEKNQFDGLKKKQILTLTREHAKLERNLGGIKNMGGLPDALFIIDAGNEKIAIQEANRLKIPVIAIVDTNTIPEGVDYLIPGNDDSMRAIHLYSKTFADTILGARSKTTQVVDEEIEVVEDTKKKTAAPAKKPAATTAAPAATTAPAPAVAPAEPAAVEAAPSAASEDKK